MESKLSKIVYSFICHSSIFFPINLTIHPYTSSEKCLSFSEHYNNVSCIVDWKPKPLCPHTMQWKNKLDLLNGNFRVIKGV